MWLVCRLRLWRKWEVGLLILVLVNQLEVCLKVEYSYHYINFPYVVFQKFMFYVLKSSDVLDVLVPILFFLNDARSDQCELKKKNFVPFFVSFLKALGWYCNLWTSFLLKLHSKAITFCISSNLVVSHGLFEYWAFKKSFILLLRVDSCECNFCLFSTQAQLVPIIK